MVPSDATAASSAPVPCPIWCTDSHADDLSVRRIHVSRALVLPVEAPLNAVAAELVGPELGGTAS